MPRKVDIIPYDPAWPLIYRAEIERVALVLGTNLISSHHIGSTSVPGLAAKPTIDILLVVHKLDALDARNHAMQALGYQPRGENGIPGRRYFNKLAGDVHLFHLHAFEACHPEVTRYLNFRDYLIAHPPVARDYQILKEELAVRFRDSPPRYTSGKAEFIRDVDGRAAAWRANLDPGGEVTH